MVGLGFDVHGFAPGRPMLLGGILVDGHDGLAGHSDGDVVCHALADAVLGAAALGDVGEHFPETDPRLEGIAGATLLARTVEIVAQHGLAPARCDLTVICDRPAIAPNRNHMREALSGVLGLSADRVSVKAARPEGLGLQGDGVGCLAVATLVEHPVPASAAGASAS